MIAILISMLNLHLYLDIKLNIVYLMKIDKHDEKIINELILDSKIPLRTLATKLGVSFVTVMNRIKRLEKSGILKGYTAIIDHEKIGYDTHVIIEISIAKGKLIELENKLAKQSNIYGVYDTTGQFDATILARFRTTRQLDHFLKTIQAYDFIEHTNTKLILNTIKNKDMIIQN